MHPDIQPSFLIVRPDTAPHLFRKDFGNGQAQSGGISGCLYRKEPLKKPLRLYEA